MIASPPGELQADVALAGGGLAAGLIALALRRARPDLRVAVVERGATLAAGHTWSFFSSDLSAEARALTAPLIAASWPGYEVRFPAHRRRIGSRYNSVEDARLHAAVAAALPAGLLVTGGEVAAVAPDRITLADGRSVSAPCVIDARGAVAGDAALAHLDLGWQKFVGVEIACEAPHGLAEPIIMDATVPQADGYRFLYALPFSPTRVLVEDTRYADGPALDRSDVAAAAGAYARAQGWRGTVLREEQGVLPIALGGDIAGFWRAADAGGVARAGLRAAMFHPTTGYSLPDAAHTALRIAALPELTTAAVAAAVRAASIAAWEQRGFFRLLDRMLFRAATPDRRYRVLERFYRLPKPLISRFYAARLTSADKLRILTGKPPVPIGRALACISEKAVLRPAA